MIARRRAPRQLRAARAVLEVVVRLVLWNLADSLTHDRRVARATCATSRSMRSRRCQVCSSRPGSRTRTTERWGAFYVFESREAAEQQLPSRARELIGKEPDIVEIFDLEATVLDAAELRSTSALAFERERSARRARRAAAAHHDGAPGTAERLRRRADRRAHGRVRRRRRRRARSCSAATALRSPPARTSSGCASSVDLSYDENVADALRLRAMLDAIDGCPAPVVAARSGACARRRLRPRRLLRHRRRRAAAPSSRSAR